MSVRGFRTAVSACPANEEHDELELERDDRIDARPTAVGIATLCSLADDAQVEFRVEAAVEVARGPSIRHLLGR